MSTRVDLEEVQGLKPILLSASDGTAEAVPFHTTHSGATDLLLRHG